eukprot:8843992-Alexandrium_andersonii.AAC.1
MTSTQQHAEPYPIGMSFEEKQLFLHDQVELMLQAATIDEPHAVVLGNTLLDHARGQFLVRAHVCAHNIHSDVQRGRTARQVAAGVPQRHADGRQVLRVHRIHLPPTAVGRDMLDVGVGCVRVWQVVAPL